MIQRRVIINLVAFFAISLLLAGYGFFTLVRNPLASTTELYSFIDDTGGIRGGFTVSLRGVPVGNVSSVGLAAVHQSDGSTVEMVKVGMHINHGIIVPADTQVQVERANPLGEQQIDLIPKVGSTAKPAGNGDILSATSTPTPPDVGQVVNAADRLFAAVPTADLQIVVHQLALALAGRADDLRSIINSSDVISKTTVSYSDAFRSLLANAPPVLNTVAAVGPQLQDALDNTEVLVNLLNRRKNDIVNLFNDGTTFANVTDALLNQDTPNLACLAKDLGDIGANLSQPTNLANLNSALLLNQSFFGPVNAITPVGPAKSLTGASGQPLPGSPNRSDQTWLRVRTLLPPQMPSAVAYAPANRIPDTYPGAACLSVFGAGVPAGHQAKPSPPAENGKVIPPPTPTVPVESSPPPTPQVSGTGAGNVLANVSVGPSAAAAPATRPAAPLAPTSGHPEEIVFVGVGLVGLGRLERRELRRLRRTWRRRTRLQKSRLPKKRSTR